MNNNSKALKSGLWYTIANFLTRAVGIITTPIFTRLLTHEEFGLYNNYTSWLSLATIVVTLNLESTFISARFDYKEKFDEYIFSTLCLSSASAFIWIFILNLCSDWAVLHLGIDKIYLNCMMIYLLFYPAINIFQVRERFKYEYKVSVALSFIITIGTALISVCLVLWLPDKLMGRIFGSSIPSIIVGLVLYLYIYHKGRHIKICYWKYALPICLPYIPHLLSLSVLNSVDRIMITKLCGAEDNALYSLAYTASCVVSILLTSLNTAYSPWLGEQLNAKRFDEIKAFSKKYIIIFSGLALGIMLISPEIILVLGGNTYMEAKYVMPPVMLGCVCQFLYTMFVNVEQYYKKTIGMAVASVSSAIINYVLNYIMIPKYGYIAAAYTTLISFLWLQLVHMFLVYRIGHSNVYNYKFIFFAVIIMTLVSVGVNFLYEHMILRFILLTAYIVLLCVCVYVNRNKISMIFKK